MSIKRKDLTEVVSIALGRRSDNVSREAQTATATYGKRRSSRQAAMSAEADRRILEAARARPPYILAAVQLQRAFGLRAGEVVESGPSLPDWERTLGQFAPIRVHGDRGGARYTHPVNWGIALQAVRFALNVMEEAGRNDLFPQITPNLALRCYQIAWKRHLTPASGEGCTSYSYRANYTRQRIIHCIQTGISEREISAIVALDLGHEDDCRHIRSLYRPIIESLNHQQSSGPYSRD